MAELSIAGFPPSKVLELPWWELVFLCDAIDRDRARRNLEMYTAIGLAFGNFEKADAIKQLNLWRDQIE